MEQYTFLLGSILSLSLYSIIYYQRADLRPQMKKFGIFVGIWSVGSSYFLWINDWWQPLTFTGTIVGIEDFIFGFAIGGVLVSGYKFFWRKELEKSEKFTDGWKNSRKVLLAFTGAFFLTYTLSGLPSWASWTIASIAGTSVLLYYRNDLIYASLGTGFICLVGSIIIYQILLAYNPQFVHQTYLLDQLSGILFTGIPVEEFVWFFTSGCLFGPYYEFYNDLEIRDKPNRFIKPHLKLAKNLLLVHRG